MFWKYAVLTLILAVSFGLYYYDIVLWLGLFKPTRNYRIKWKYDPINNDTQLMTEYLVTLGHPVIITDSPFVNHEIMQLTFKNLANSLQHFSCKYSQEHVFQYHAVDQPLDAIPEFIIQKPYQNVMISAKEFFTELQSSSNNKFFYSSGGIEQLKLPLSFELFTNVTFPPYKGLSQFNYWFGSTNVTAYTHYDTSHNLHFVVRGRKKFLLTPPSYSPDLFPCLHSLYRQTQVDISEPHIILDVLPGEVLYLPPYWFHSVITVEPSISFNIWSDSKDFLLMEEILNSPIPFEAKWNKDKLMQAAKYFINCLIENLALPKTFVKDHVFSRYKLLLANLTSSNQEQNFVSLVEKYCLSSLFNKQEAFDIHDRALKTASLFRNMTSKEILKINFGNYIEQISYTILREHIIELPFFLKYCF